MILSDIQVDRQTQLRHLRIDDAQIIFEAIDSNRTFLRTWLPFVDSTKQVGHTYSFVKSIVDDVERRQEIFTIYYQDQFAGLIGLKDIDYLNKKVELGYWMIEKMTGKGIMIHSVERIIEFCFAELSFNRIQIKCGVGNIRSSNIPKKLGFLFEGIERNGEKCAVGFRDLEVYSLLKKEWSDF